MKGNTIRLILVSLMMTGSMVACYRHAKPDEKVVIERRMIVSDVEPPAPRTESMTDSPMPGYVWTGGYWNWEKDAYVWHPGRWEAPREGYHWVPPTWVKVDGKWQLQGGTWEVN